MEQKKIESKILITNKLGLHARAASKFVDLTSKCDSKFIVKKGLFMLDLLIFFSILFAPISVKKSLIFRIFSKCRNLINYKVYKNSVF